MAQGLCPCCAARPRDRRRCRAGAREHHDPACRSERQDAGWNDGHDRDGAVALVNSQGRPNVKIAAHERGAGALVAGNTDPTWVQILAENGSTTLKLSNQDGRVQVVKP
jgi:hypothetical protein